MQSLQIPTNHSRLSLVATIPLVGIFTPPNLLHTSRRSSPKLFSRWCYQALPLKSQSCFFVALCSVSPCAASLIKKFQTRFAMEFTALNPNYNRERDIKFGFVKCEGIKSTSPTKEADLIKRMACCSLTLLDTNAEVKAFDDSKAGVKGLVDSGYVGLIPLMLVLRMGSLQGPVACLSVCAKI